MSAAPTIFWFRADLRLTDNPALTAALEQGSVLPVFIWDETPPIRPLGGAARWWLDKSLRALAADLAVRGAPLILRRGPALGVLEDLIAETGAQEVFWNRLYDPASIARDSELKARLTQAGVRCRSYNASLLIEPWEVATQTGGPFRVFSAFWRAAEPRVACSDGLAAPAALRPPEKTPASDPIDAWSLHPEHPDWSGGFGEWTPGESGAAKRLQTFLDEALFEYSGGRDRPDRAWTSKLSPHLHFGEIGPRQVWRAVQARALTGASLKSSATFLKELGWREFNHHLLFHYPRTPSDNLDARFDAFPWRESSTDLKLWQRGKTGYPIIDAGMRELWRTGWMHNRVRMIVASFLIKDLLIDWRLGEAWFWDTLVDADIANNVAGWQWTAGSGADAAPYFRVFNPVLQGERFDPEGDYVRRWVPELSRLPASAIHAPWRSDSLVLSDAGVRLGVTYPYPLVDHAQARDRALKLYKELP